MNAASAIILSLAIMTAPLLACDCQEGAEIILPAPEIDTEDIDLEDVESWEVDEITFDKMYDLYMSYTPTLKKPTT